jgi:hypothetical protein
MRTRLLTLLAFTLCATPAWATPLDSLSTMPSASWVAIMLALPALYLLGGPFDQF